MTLLNYQQKARMMARVNKLKTPSYFELKSNRNYWHTRAPKRTEFKRLLNKTVTYTGQIMAVRRYNSDSHYYVHILLKPVTVSNITTDHLWIRVGLHKFNKIYRRLYPEFNCKTEHISHKTVTTNTPIFVTGHGKLVLYTRRNKKLHDTFNEEYGFQDVTNIRVLNNKELNELPVQFSKIKNKRIASKQFKYSQQLFADRIKLNLSRENFAKKLNIDLATYTKLEQAIEPDVKNYQKVLIKLNAEKGLLWVLKLSKPLTNHLNKIKHALSI